MSESVEIRGLDKLFEKMRRFPKELEAGVKVTMTASLLTLWENVPAYPPPPEGSKYVRKGAGGLGGSLGSSETGGKSSNEPDVYTSRPLGDAGYEGRFGTQLDYAPYVIGEGTQAPIHEGRWWTMRTIAENASEKIQRLWENLGAKMVAFLNRKG